MADRYPHVISGRFTNEEGVKLSHLRVATVTGTWSAAIRFFLEDPVCWQRAEEFMRQVEPAPLEIMDMDPDDWPEDWLSEARDHLVDVGLVQMDQQES